MNSQGSSASIGQYAIRRLLDYGVNDLFGIPGDYVLTFYSLLEESDINIYGCTREDSAGFAADAYARVNGMGAICVTYCVGGLSVCNSIAGAFAEKSPVVMLTGSPGLSERKNNPLLHHKVRHFRTQYEVFEKLCVAATEINDPVTAFSEIDRVLDACSRFKRPVYLDIPRDMVDVVPHISQNYQPSHETSDPKAISEAADEACRLIAKAKKPVIVAGVEIHRFGLQDKLNEFIEQTGIPVASTILGKGVFGEHHPQYLGWYAGGMGDSKVAEYVESSDCLILLGTFMSDINLGIFTAQLDASQCIYATSEHLQIHYHHYHNIEFVDFINELVERQPTSSAQPYSGPIKPSREPFQLKAENPITISRMMGRLNELIDDKTMIIADIGDSLFGATELDIPTQSDFLSPAYYTSMGFSVPATLGACVAKPDHRVIAICGDGAFQMTGMELSSIVRYGLSPIIIVNDNQGYGTERVLHSGNWEYNEIHGWDYSQLMKVLRGGTGYEIHTEGEFDQAILQAWQDRSGPSLLHVHTNVEDSSFTLNQLAERLSSRV